jgi:tRNA nucleotidyltransferase/poly(A) polymerase
MVGSKLTTKRMKNLRFDNDTIKAVARLVELHMRFYGYGDAGWTDSAVRRYVTDAGPLLERLHRLTRSDVTTRNQRKADRLSFAYDDLESRIAALRDRESPGRGPSGPERRRDHGPAGPQARARRGQGVQVPAGGTDGKRPARPGRRRVPAPGMVG